MTFDIAVLGSGPGGYVAAIRASQLGLKACVIEKDKIGGVCLNIGCIPSKALIHQAEQFRAIADLENMNVKVDVSGLDYKKVFQKSRDAANTLSKGVQFLLKKNKVETIEGTGVFSGKNELTVTGKDGKQSKIKAKNILIATGSRPRELGSFPFDGKKILSSNEALMLEKLPKKMLILGGGAIGCEFAHILGAFGVEVTIVEILGHILPLEDKDTAEVLAKSFKKRGIKLLAGHKITSVKSDKNGVKADIEDSKGKKQTLDADQMLVVAGRVPNTEEIGLDKIGIKAEKGFIPVGDYYQTTVPGVFAIGDVVNSPLLAHVASKEGEIAVEFMAGKKPEKKLDPDKIPSGVYTEPEVASFGLKEEDAKEKGIKVKASIFPYRGAGKSVAIEKSEGIVKILTNPETGEILGGHIAGAEATDLIHELLLAKSAELLPEDIATMVHAHPTLSESVMEAARAAEGWAIHI